MGCSTGSLGPQPLWDMFSFQHLLSNWSELQQLNRESWGAPLLGAGILYRILSPTAWTSCAPSYIIVPRPPSSCGCHKSHSFNPSMVKVVFWYSSIGFASNLHRFISYFDRPAGSEVNIQHELFILSASALLFPATAFLLPATSLLLGWCRH